MPAVVQKSATATNNIVCVSQACNVADDGLVTVRARFLLRSASDANFFELDARWPSGSSPRGLPRNQGGPYLVSRDFEYSSGLVFVNATYVTAMNPVRVVYSKNRSTRAFSGLIAIVENGVATTVTAKFDYTTEVASALYNLVDDAVFSADLTNMARIVSITGVSSTLLSKIAKKNIVSEDRLQIGKVTQVTKSVEVVFYTE